MEMSKSSFKFACKSSPFSPSHPDFIILPDDYDDETVVLKPDDHLSQVVLPSTSIPTIDMKIDHGSLVSKISDACENYGFFQIINHGFSRDLYQQMMDVATDFFGLPYEERAKLYSDDPNVSVRIETPRLKLQNQNRVRMWTERLLHPADPTHEDDYIHLLPENPPRYREVAAAYSKEITDLICRLWGLISEGLGLETNYLQTRLHGSSKFCQTVNFYPPCPDPELTMGVPVHTDIGVITILQQVQGVSGLQVIKDGKWLAVDPLPDAFIVNVADQLEVMSNGRYKSVHHRAVTNQVTSRISIITFSRLNNDAIVGPIEDLINEEQPAIYRNYHFEEFLKEFSKQLETRWNVKQVFQLHPST
ncbi:Oxoglutarate/iron-dependent dioxygenase [Macleaya cordata]|uniref:Oxoglutarate/iron-dependent dioxygenase n=1 Tax=Macleaya cordata TaxID=56857 RepID=A0A200Q143_MACCD|nr:Oxoglutarate/iron-dependent dioxygenase [Macleaya cordata]